MAHGGGRTRGSSYKVQWTLPSDVSGSNRRPADYKTSEEIWFYVDADGNEIPRGEWLAAYGQQLRESRPGITKDEVMKKVAKRDYWYNANGQTVQRTIAPLATQEECVQIRLAEEATLKKDYEKGLVVHLVDLIQSRRSPQR
jgi:hypothetical protein